MKKVLYPQLRKLCVLFREERVEFRKSLTSIWKPGNSNGLQKKECFERAILDVQKMSWKAWRIWTGYVQQDGWIGFYELHNRDIWLNLEHDKSSTVSLAKMQAWIIVIVVISFIGITLSRWIGNGVWKGSAEAFSTWRTTTSSKYSKFFVLSKRNDNSNNIDHRKRKWWKAQNFAPGVSECCALAK